jgi:hypothetical protein
MQIDRLVPQEISILLYHSSPLLLMAGLLFQHQISALMSKSGRREVALQGFGPWIVIEPYQFKILEG